MVLAKKFVAALAAAPWLLGGLAAVGFAQTSDRFADWMFLYEDTFENSNGQEVTQQWWLAPNPTRQNNLMNFTLLARRSPVSSNGTAAAVFDYVADCSTMNYTIEGAEFLNSNDDILDTQTYQRVMEAADPEQPFYDVLQDVCGGA
jgi:hypothetical protein